MPPQPPPFISVVIPTYNHAALLGDAIESLKAQDYPPDRYEIVVSDDGSTDNTASVAEAAQRDAQVRLLYERRPHGGVNAARNAGIEAASGEIICLLDADEIAPPGWLSAIEAQLGERPDLGYIGGPYVAWPQPRSPLCKRSRYNQLIAEAPCVKQRLDIADASGGPDLVLDGEVGGVVPKADFGIVLAASWTENLGAASAGELVPDVVSGTYEPALASFLGSYAVPTNVPPLRSISAGNVRSRFVGSCPLRRSASELVGGFPDLQVTERLCLHAATRERRGRRSLSTRCHRLVIASRPARTVLPEVLVLLLPQHLRPASRCLAQRARTHQRSNRPSLPMQQVARANPDSETHIAVTCAGVATTSPKRSRLSPLHILFESPGWPSDHHILLRQELFSVPPEKPQQPCLAVHAHDIDRPLLVDSISTGLEQFSHRRSCKPPKMTPVHKTSIVIVPPPPQQ